MIAPEFVYYNLKFTPKEASEVNQFLKESGLEDSPEGLAQFVKDYVSGDIEDEEKQSPRPNVILESLKNNPDAVFEIGKTVFSAFKRKK